MRSTHGRQRIGMLIAVIVAIAVVGGGSATAASMITGRQIQDESVTGRDIRNNSVKGRDVDESSLATVPSARHAQSARNAGSASSISNLDYNVSDAIDNFAGSQDGGYIGCDSGESAVGGGVLGMSAGTAQSVNSSLPSGSGGWEAYVNNTGSVDSTFHVFVICTTAGTVSKASDDAPAKK